MNLQNIADYLESYSGRDKVMRILYYSTQCAAGITNSKPLETKFNSFSAQINSCRTVLRLFDDIPMLCYTLSYGLGRKEPDKLLRFCGIAVNCLDQMYYLMEHIAWAADSELIPLKSNTYWLASSFCWALSMYIMMIKSIRHYRILRRMKHIVERDNLNSRLTIINDITHLESNELLTATRCFLDCVHAIHWLPAGILWAGKLKQWQIGALGILSSLITIYQS